MFGISSKIALGTGIALALSLSALFITRHTLANRTEALAAANGLLLEIGESASNLAGPKHKVAPGQVPVFLERFRGALIEAQAARLTDLRREQQQRSQESERVARSLEVQLASIRSRVAGMRRAGASGAYPGNSGVIALPGVPRATGGANGAPLLLTLDITDAVAIEEDRARHNALIDWVEAQLAVKPVE